MTSSAEEPSDESVVAQLAAGHQESIVPLLVRYAPRVLTMAVAAVDRTAAEEIVQDVFVAVWRNATTFDATRGSFQSWLLTITRNRIANELRRRGRGPEGQSAAVDGDWARFPATGPGPADSVWHDFRRQTLRAAVDSLPPKQRQALSLAFFDELTHEQVAAALDVPLGTAKTRIRSALEMLRTRLSPLRASLIAGLLLLIALVWQEHRHAARLDQERRALWLVTSSDVVPVRLEAVAGTDSRTHGTYRGRAGEPLAVLTFSRFPPAPAGKEYRAWARHGDRWIDLGSVPLDADGNGRLIAEDPSLAKLPDSMRVTLESVGARRPAPAGPPVIVWPKE
jgi:RNA polymerase sigma-70 factor (ECF subfamily)